MGGGCVCDMWMPPGHLTHCQNMVCKNVKNFITGLGGPYKQNLKFSQTEIRLDVMCAKKFEKKAYFWFSFV